jgi:hypothetical protein
MKMALRLGDAERNLDVVGGKKFFHAAAASVGMSMGSWLTSHFSIRRATAPTMPMPGFLEAALTNPD